MARLLALFLALLCLCCGWAPPPGMAQRTRVASVCMQVPSADRLDDEEGMPSSTGAGSGAVNPWDLPMGSPAVRAPVNTPTPAPPVVSQPAGPAAGARTQWDDSSFDNEPMNRTPIRPPAVATASPPPPNRDVQTTNVGIISGPYKRRRGYHTEVAVQHPGGLETKHRLWFGHEVLGDVAALRGRVGEDIDVERFSEATIAFLKDKGVGLADPDWALEDDTIPFSSDHLPVRTLFEYYGSELMEYLAESTLHDWVPDDEAPSPENLGRYEHLPKKKDLEEHKPYPCLGAWDGPPELNEAEDADAGPEDSE